MQVPKRGHQSVWSLFYKVAYLQLLAEVKHLTSHHVFLTSQFLLLALFSLYLSLRLVLLQVKSGTHINTH